MILIDSCGWLELIKGAEMAPSYARALAVPEEVVVPVICIIEVGRVMRRERGEVAVAQCLALMSQGSIVPLDQRLAESATILGVDNRLPLADSIIYATAQQYKAELWTHDGHFQGLPGVHFVE